ncbi:MAG: radical SAM protein [Nanoarchaeota archaeon]
MKIILSTLPKEGGAIQWFSPKYYLPDTSAYAPLGLLSLATNIPQGNEVKILDPHSHNWSIDRTMQEIEKEKPDILGLSVVTSKAYQMTQILKNTSALYKVVGGPHVTHNYNHILSQGADAVFLGQLADLEFSEAIQVRPRGVIECNTQINQIKFPDRSFIDQEFYYSTGNLFKSNKRMSMFSGVGCPNHCNFCDVQTKKIHRKDTKAVLDEMIYLQSIGAGSVHVYEDNFNTDKRYLEKLCKEMDKREFSLEWSGRGQAKMDLGTAKMLSDRKFKRIHVGIEALSDETLRFFGKKQDVNQVQEFCDIMNKNSIDIVGFFIIGTPTETEEDRKTLSKKVKELGIKYPLFSILQPLPNTQYYKDLLNQGVYQRDFWGDYIKNPTKDFMIPFPYGEDKWKRDAKFIEELIDDFKNNPQDDF